MKERVIVVTFATGVGLLMATTAFALEPCGDVVVDAANILSTNDENRITAAAGELAALGVTVRVRTSVDIGQYASLHEAADMVCADAWGGDRIVYWVVTGSHDAGIFAGPAWVNKISDTTAADMIDDYMLPGLQSGSFANAFIQPIRATAELVRPIPVTEPKVATTTPERAPTVVEQKPAANEWSFATVAAGFFTLLLLVVGWFGLRFWQTERNRKDKIIRIQQAAVIAGNQCLGILESFNTWIEELTSQLISQKGVLSDEVLESFTARLVTLQTDAKQVNEEFNGHNDPATAGKELSWYEVSLDSMQGTKQHLQSIADAFQVLQAEVTATVEVAIKMPTRLRNITVSTAARQATLADLAAAGFTVSNLQQELDNQKAALTAANAKALQKAYAEADIMLQQIVVEIARIERVSAALPAQKQHLTELLATLTDSFNHMPEKVVAASNIFTTIEQNYAESSYASIAGNGTEAEVRLDEVEELLATVPSYLEKQQFETAEGALQHVATLLDEVASLLEAIVTLEKKLISAKREVTTELVEAKRSIAAALTYLSNYDADTSDHHLEELTRAQKLCETVDKMLREQLPDYIEALALATKADSMADAVLSSAEDEHAQAERSRRQAKTLREQAINDAAEMQQYIKNHQSDINRSTVTELTILMAELETLRDQSDVSAIISQSRKISERSAELQSDAARDFKAAEVKRTAAQSGEGSSGDSSGTTRPWGTARPPSSTGAVSSWRASPGASTGATRAFSAPSPARSTGAVRKW